MNRGELNGHRVPYICPFPDTNRMGEIGEYVSILVQTAYRGPRRLLTSAMVMKEDNLVLFELWLVPFTRRD